MSLDSLTMHQRSGPDVNLEVIKSKCEYFELVQYKCTLLYDQAICQPYSRYFESCPNKSRKEITPTKMKKIQALMQK